MEVDMRKYKIYFSCTLNRIFHSFVLLTREISWSTLRINFRFPHFHSQLPFFYEQTFASPANNSFAYKFTDEATSTDVLFEEIISHSFNFTFALPTTEYLLKEFSNLCKIKATISKCDKSMYMIF